MTRRFLALAVALLTVWTPALADVEEVTVVEAYFEAFNFHDVEGMMAMVAEDVRWMSIDNDEIATVTDSRGQLADALREYFSSVPTARSRIRSIAANGEYVSVVEEALWRDGDETRRQCATTVYQIDREIITNVWYFGEQVCDD